MTVTQWQNTVAGPVVISGSGLHSGRPCRLTIVPASVDDGIRWQRTDLPDLPTIPATVARVVATDRATTIGHGDARVQTIEHVMAALSGLGIDNALVQLDGPEPPFADGAAAVFAQNIVETGIVQQDAPRRALSLRTPVAASRGDALIVALPRKEPGMRVSYTFVSDNAALGTQFAEHDIDPAEFLHDVAPARTVGWLAEVEALQRRGLARGITEDAAIVVDGDELLAPMKFSNEVARHKVLDIVGDLALIGPLQAHIVAVRSGHALHVELARALATRATHSSSTAPILTEEETKEQ